MVHEVYKRISKGRDPETGEETFLKTGSLVESGTWKNERSLIAQGFLGVPRKSQTEINKFLTKNKGKTIARTNTPIGVKRPASEPKIENIPVAI